MRIGIAALAAMSALTLAGCAGEHAEDTAVAEVAATPAPATPAQIEVTFNGARRVLLPCMNDMRGSICKDGVRTAIRELGVLERQLPESASYDLARLTSQNVASSLAYWVNNCADAITVDDCAQNLPFPGKVDAVGSEIGKAAAGR
jgi:hypothetical protein